MWRKGTLLVTLLLALCLLAGGCVSTGETSASIGTGFRPSGISRIVPGTTTRAEIMEIFGCEYIQEASPDVIRFERITLEAHAVGGIVAVTHCRAEKDGIRITFEGDVVAHFERIR